MLEILVLDEESLSEKLSTVDGKTNAVSELAPFLTVDEPSTGELPTVDNELDVSIEKILESVMWPGPEVLGLELVLEEEKMTARTSVELVAIISVPNVVKEAMPGVTRDEFVRLSLAELSVPRSDAVGMTEIDDWIMVVGSTALKTMEF